MSLVFSGVAIGGDIRLLVDNSLEYQGKKAALYGIAVPRATEKCIADENSWPCGATATLRLNELIKSTSLDCSTVLELEDISVINCTDGEVDISRQLVKEGWALTIAELSDYEESEQYAKQNHLGVWRGGFIPPDTWRQYPDTTLDPYLDLLCSVCSARKQ